jgi:hypothetical protein
MLYRKSDQHWEKQWVQEKKGEEHIKDDKKTKCKEHWGSKLHLQTQKHIGMKISNI